MAWVLSGAYGYEKAIILSVLRQILATAELAVEDPALAWGALGEFEQGSADFADYLIGHGNHAHGGSRTYTFDRSEWRWGRNPLRPLRAVGGGAALHGVGLEDEHAAWSELS